MVSADDVLAEAHTAQQEVVDHVRPVADWFHAHEGELYRRPEAARRIADDLDISEGVAHRAIINLLEDHIDPVVQVPTADQHYVGVIDYHEHDCWYGFTDYHDTLGQRKTGVCAACVKEYDVIKRVSYAASGDGTLPSDADWDAISDKLSTHFRKAHPDTTVEAIETGASLLGTQINGNTAWSSGNGGSGSNFNADLFDGHQPGDIRRRGELKATWYDTQTYYNNNGHPTTTSGLDAFFNPNNSGVGPGGMKVHYDRVAWADSTSAPDPQPGYIRPFTADAEGYSWKAEGYLYADESGTYSFSVDGDDACDLFVNGSLVASYYGGHGFAADWTADETNRSNGTASLSAGNWYSFKVRMEEGGGGSGVAPAWQKPSQTSFGYIPGSYYSIRD